MRRDTECFEAHQYILTACLAVEDLSKTTTAVNVRSRLCGAALIVRSLAAVLQLVHQPLAVCSSAAGAVLLSEPPPQRASQRAHRHKECKRIA